MIIVIFYCANQRKRERGLNKISQGETNNKGNEKSNSVVGCLIKITFRIIAHCREI